MKKFSCFILLFVVSFFFSCEINNSNKSNTKVEKIWLQFEKAFETNDLDFLKNNSFDSIYCDHCYVTKKNPSYLYFSDSLITNNYKELKHVNSLKNYKFSAFLEDSITIRVTYKINEKKVFKEAYGLIYTLKKVNNHFYLYSVILQ